MAAPFRLWQGRRFTPDTLPLLPQVTHVQVHTAHPKHYVFLLGTDIVAYHNRLFCSWGHSYTQENDSRSIMAVKESADDGMTWENLSAIARNSDRQHAYSHGVMFVHQDTLFALAPFAQFGNTTTSCYGTMKTKLFAYDGKHWTERGTAIDQPFWPMAKPSPLTNGNLLLPGIVCNGFVALPAVAVSRGDDLSRWSVTIIPTLSRKDRWGEGGIIARQNHITAIFRSGWKSKAVAQVAHSLDFGRTWSKATPSNLPMEHAKPCCGTLSNGQNYLIFNPTGNQRNTLAIATSKPNELSFSKIWRIQHGTPPVPHTNGPSAAPQWSYPNACESKGNLYVTYNVNKEDARLSIIPVTALSH